jgi:hypothetical protein
VYHKLSSDVRFSFQAKETREGGAPTQAELGPSLDFYLKPPVKLEKVTWFDPDDSKQRLLVLSIGYRYLPSPNSPPVNRIEPVATFHFPLKAGFLLSDRNRADLDWQKGNFTWRYRNLIQIERRLTIRSYHLAPYGALWSSFTRANIASGVIRQSTPGACSLGRRFEFDPLMSAKSQFSST